LGPVPHERVDGDVSGGARACAEEGAAFISELALPLVWMGAGRLFSS
jgi:hypothetical protein